VKAAGFFVEKISTERCLPAIMNGAGMFRQRADVGACNTAASPNPQHGATHVKGYT